MVFPIPACFSAIYTPSKDLFLYLKGKSEEIDELKERLSSLRVNLAAIISRKEDIDRSLGTSVTKKKSKEYEMMENEFVLIRNQYSKFISKYSRITRVPDIATTELDDSFTALVMEKFEEIKSTILTFSFFKLAKLSRDIAKLDKRATRALVSLEPKHMIHNTNEPNQETKFDGNDLPVFREYVSTVFRHLSGNKNRVGITGPSGVGKTTVMQKLYNQLLIDKKFDKIIWIDDKKTGLELQAEIMLQLGTDHEKTNSTIVNADRISSFLGKRKYILLMDQVSERIDLNNLGIREDHEYGNVVIASTEIKAISSMINVEVKIERLNPGNAWLLFESICGEVRDQREGPGRLIVKCCGGLPRMIKSVATHLKDLPEESSWMHTKKIIQSDTDCVANIGLAGFDVYYKKKYEELEDSYKKCFLYAALFPHEDVIQRDHLIECWMAECFLENKNIAQPLRESRDSGQGILDVLTRAYLLEWFPDRKRVRMPSICRRVALQQKYPDEEDCVNWAPLDHVNPDEETWKTVKRMSLIGCKAELPERPECQNIYTLLLRSKPELEMLPGSFFSHMDKLLVLDVYDTNITVLPSSINNLVNLKCLYLNCCKHLEMLPPEAAYLKKLQSLDIRGTSIYSLPQEIGKMVDLRCLRASFSPEAGSDEVIIPLDIIKNLKMLEELSIDTGLYRPPGKMAEDLAKELASLKYLSTLHFNFPNFSSFNTFVAQSESLKNKETTWELSTFRSFKISVGFCAETQHPHESDVQEILAERRLRISLNEEFSSACQELSKQASAFELIGDQSVETLSQFDLHSVEVCVVGNCSRLKNVVEAGNATTEVQEIVEESSDGVLRNLKKLHLYNLPLLQCVWEGKVSPQSLNKLVVLTLSDCPKLTKILDLALARNLPSLKRLKVENCCNVVHIVEVTEESDLLNSVETIELINLSNLENICNSTSMSWISLNSMFIRSCSKLCNLSLEQSNANKLASIDCERRWWDQLQFPDAAVKQRLSQFCQFKEGSFELGETSTVLRPQFSQASKDSEPGTNDNQASITNGGNDEESHEKNRLINEDHKASGVYVEDVETRGVCFSSFGFLKWKQATKFQVGVK